MVKTIKFLVNILTILALFLGSVVIVQNCCKIAKTGMNLMVLNDNIQFYNEQERKTDNMTEEAKYYFSERQKIYDSEDCVVRTFSNLNTVMKVIAFLISILMIPMILFMWFYHVLRMVYRYRKKRAKRRAKRSSN